MTIAALPPDLQWLHDSDAGSPSPGRLWSLWNIMINYNLFGLCKSLEMIQSFQRDYEMRSQRINEELQSGTSYDEIVKNAIPHEVSDADKEKISWMLTLISGEIASITSTTVVHVIGRLNIRLARESPSVHDIANELRFLRETIGIELTKV